MNKFIAVALLSAAVAMPAFADDAAKAPAKKAVPAQKGKMKPMAGDKDDCHAHSGMGGGHYGHGMGYGGGHGMGMGGMGMGGGMAMPMMPALDLSKEQQDKITKLTDELRHNNWNNQGLINDETAKLRDLYEADKRDPAAIGKEYQKVFDLKRQMIEDYLNTQNRIEEVLTPEQLAKLKDARRSGYRHW